MAYRLGELLLREGLINESQLKEALEYQKERGGRLGSIFINLGFVSEEDIAEVLSKQQGVPAINLSKFEIDKSVLNIIPEEHCRKALIIPISKIGDTLTLAMVEPTNLMTISEIEFMTGLKVQPVIAPESAIRAAIDKHYGTTSEVEIKKTFEEFQGEFGTDESIEFLTEEEEMNIAEMEQEAEKGPIVQYVNNLIKIAVEKGASDIHIEPYEKKLRVRYRIDGILYEQQEPPYTMKDGIITRVKVISKLRIDEKRVPQDGRIKTKIKLANGKVKEIDMRVSTLPTLYGEKVVMRILDKEQLRLDLTQLGFEEESLEKFKRAIRRPWGIILVTGPTGSGKTNTLYSAISTLNSEDTNIMTVEDPVEFNLYGINQVNVNEDAGLNFASALRSFLRQDPNIILVGEIRDFETADIAIKAALTGHLVLSTLHTNDAPSTITRLINMGIEPYLVASSLLLVVAQRLVRRLCNKCKEEASYPPKALIDVGFNPDEVKNLKIYKAKGCAACNHTGYKGRVGLFEVMEISEEIKEMIISMASTSELRRKAIEEGMYTLRMSGLEKVKKGLTSIEEVVRETVKV